jgi:hypothetical protein
VDLSDADQVNGILPLDQGGTARSLVPNAGAIVWSGADGLYIGPAGAPGQVLVSDGPNEYAWGSALLILDQPANVVYAGPAAGPNAPTAFRALVNADIPATLTSKTISGSTITTSTVDSTVIGGNTAAAGTFTTVTADNVQATNLKAKDGTAAGSIANATGVVTLTSSVLTTTDINGGTIDATVIGGATPAAGSFTSVDADFVQFDTTAVVTDVTGRLYYDAADMFQTLAFQMNGAVVQHVGEELYYRVRLSANATKGQVLMFTGTLGASGGLRAAPATGLAADQSNYILGVAMESGSTNDWITVVEFGEVKGINTTGGAEVWTQGQVLYFNPAVAGGLTKNKPTTPNAIAVIAAVVHVGSSNGILFVRPTFGSVLGGTDGNVEFTALTNGDVIVYDSTDARWENVAASALSVGSATTATNVAGGAAGSIPYQSGAGSTAMLATGTGVLVGGTTPSYSTTPALTGTNFTGIPNGALSNSSLTLGTTSVALGATSLTLAGLTAVTLTQDPAAALDAATKQYVDTLVSTGTVYHEKVAYEVPSTTGNLNATYDNGTAGVGATLTNAGANVVFTPDGTAAIVSDRVLVYNQTNQFENGVYEVTTVGDGATPWVLTRTTDADSYGLNDPNTLGAGSTFFVSGGATGAGETYTCNTQGTITFGTTAITFAQVSAAQVYSAGNGLTLTNTQFSLTTPVAAANGGTGIAGYATGDLIYANSATTLDKLAIGVSARILTSNGTSPTWTDPASVAVGSATTATNVAGGAVGDIPYQSAAGTTALLAAGAADYVLKANGAAAPSWVAQSTLSVGSATTASSATTATTAGSATTATTASNVAGGAAGSIVYQSGTAATAMLALGTQGYVLRAGATAPEWATIDGGTF